MRQLDGLDSCYGYLIFDNPSCSLQISHNLALQPSAIASSFIRAVTVQLHWPRLSFDVPINDGSSPTVTPQFRIHALGASTIQRATVAPIKS